MFVINRNIIFPDECLRLRIDRSELAQTILEAGRAITFIATGFEHALLCNLFGLDGGYHYTGTASHLPEFLPGDKVLVLDLTRESYLYTVHESFGEPRLVPEGTREKKLILP